MELRVSTAADRAAADMRGGRHIENGQWLEAIGRFLMHGGVRVTLFLNG